MKSFSQKKQLLSYLFILWSQSKINNSATERNHRRECIDREFNQLMNQAFLQLNDEQRTIIMKEFMEKASPNWYLEYYSRSSFYRHKHHSMDTFIRCLHGRKMLK